MDTRGSMAVVNLVTALNLGCSEVNLVLVARLRSPDHHKLSSSTLNNQKLYIRKDRRVCTVLTADVATVHGRHSKPARSYDREHLYFIRMNPCTRVHTSKPSSRFSNEVQVVGLAKTPFLGTLQTKLIRFCDCEGYVVGLLQVLDRN